MITSKKLYSAELGNLIKIAYKLTDKVINPHSIERLNVKIADSLFHESTVNGLNYYLENGYPQIMGTANFLSIVRKWWESFNVHSKFMGTAKRN